MSISRWMDKKAVVHMHHGILLRYLKKCIWISSNEVDETGAYYTEWSKSERERQIVYDLTYMWNPKTNKQTTELIKLVGEPMFISALFIIARTWKQPRCPSADEWIRKLWYIYTMEYYSAIKKNSFESVLMRWMKLEPIIQSEVSQKEKHQYSILTHIYGI